MATATELAVIEAAQKSAGELHRQNPALDLVELATRAVVIQVESGNGQETYPSTADYMRASRLFQTAFTAEYVALNQPAPVAQVEAPRCLHCGAVLKYHVNEDTGMDWYTCDACPDTFMPDEVTK